jgi:pimeloyl-ACP methyl ester carboxylesterase
MPGSSPASSSRPRFDALLASGVSRLSILACGLASACVAGASPPVDLRPCTLPGLEEPAFCGEHAVWEDRASKLGRKISLRIALLPARAANPEPDPIVVLQGGPGASNVASAQASARSPLRSHRHILLIDLRGTGGSGALDCAFQRGHSAIGYLEDFLPIAGVRACRDSLARNADLDRYVTPWVIEDLAEVLTALRFERVNLHGFSGGTRQALAFIRRYPARVRSALLEGPVPIDARVPLTFARDAQHAFEGVATECLADSACARAFPNLQEELRAVVRRLDSAPVLIDVPGVDGRAPGRLPLSRSAFAQIVRYMLYRPRSAAGIPLAVHRAAQGDFSRFGELAASVGVGATISIGFYLSNTCSEDLPWFTDQEGAAAARQTYLGDYRLRQQRAACAEWPTAPLPDKYRDPVRSDVPVLVLVGARDPVTPPRWGREIVQHLTRGRLVEVPDGGHAFSDLEPADCLPTLRDAFLDQAGTENLPLECVSRLRRPPFLLS